jgi:hypothetical protein
VISSSGLIIWGGYCCCCGRIRGLGGRRIWRRIVAWGKQGLCRCGDSINDLDGLEGRIQDRARNWMNGKVCLGDTGPVSERFRVQYAHAHVRVGIRMNSRCSARAAATRPVDGSERARSHSKE